MVTSVHTVKPGSDLPRVHPSALAAFSLAYRDQAKATHAFPCTDPALLDEPGVFLEL